MGDSRDSGVGHQAQPRAQPWVSGTGAARAQKSELGVREPQQHVTQRKAATEERETASSAWFQGPLSGNQRGQALWDRERGLPTPTGSSGECPPAGSAEFSLALLCGGNGE